MITDAFQSYTPTHAIEKSIIWNILQLSIQTYSWPVTNIFIPWSSAASLNSIIFPLPSFSI